ncbi:MAG: carbonic anhydrase [Pseudonocardiaceae bacterium]
MRPPPLARVPLPAVHHRAWTLLRYDVPASLVVFLVAARLLAVVGVAGPAQDHDHGGLHALFAGVREYHRRSAPEVLPHLEQLVDRQRPRALFLTCADSRVLPNVLTSSGPGDLFTVRNLGNLVPSPGHKSDSSVAASLEYAVHHLQVPSILVSDIPAVRRCTVCSVTGPSPGPWAGGCGGACQVWRSRREPGPALHG